MQFHDVQQNTEEWHELRCGKITGSALSKAMANFGKAFGDPAKKYASQIALEQITGRYITDGYSNEHTERGHSEEPLARMEYEESYFCNVENGGFFENGIVGCSPDGLVGKEGLIEIKSAIPSVHVDRIRKQSFDSQYKWQLIGNMKLTNRQWIDFISYCSSFPEGKKLYVCRLEANSFKKEFEMIDARIAEFSKLIQETKDLIINNRYSVKVA